jgi:hypothetical protein
VDVVALSEVQPAPPNHFKDMNTDFHAYPECQLKVWASIRARPKGQLIDMNAKLVLGAALLLATMTLVPGATAMAKINDQVVKVNIHEVCDSPPTNNGSPGSSYSYSCTGVSGNCEGTWTHYGHYDSQGHPVEDYSTFSGKCIDLATAIQLY